MPTRILTPSRARRLLERYRAGKLSQVAFCRKHHISTSLFAYWMPRFRAPEAPSKASFQELHLPSTPISHGPCLLTFPSGARLEFPASHIPQVLSALTEGKTPC